MRPPFVSAICRGAALTVSLFGLALAGCGGDDGSGDEQGARPGPEFIYQVAGRIEYQNALIGTEELGPRGAEAIPPDTAVQKRNPFGADACFLSWFLVDPDKPFAPAAEF